MKIKHKTLLKILTNNFLSLFLIPLVLLIFFVLCTVFLNKQISFSVLLYGHDNKSIITKPSGKLLKGEKITGEFTAKENYLGIVIVRFNPYIKPDYRGEDVLLFGLKEKGGKDWYYYNAYRSGSIESQQLFPFGFPVITFSKDKVYDFQIESIAGNEVNSVELSNSNPVLLTAYKLPRVEIVGSKLRLISYLIKKSINSLTSLDILFSSILYLLPFLFYIFWLFFLRKTQLVRRFLAFTVIALIFLNIFLLSQFFIGILVGLIIAWIVTIWIYGLESSVSFVFALILIFIWVLLILLQISVFIYELNIWSFTLLTIGTIQLSFEEKRNLKKLVGYKEFFSSLFKFKE